MDLDRATSYSVTIAVNESLRRPQVFTLFDWAIASHRRGRAVLVAILVTASTVLPAIAHDSSGPLQPLTRDETEATSSAASVAAPAPVGHVARWQVDEAPLWQPYRSHKRSRTLASTGQTKGSTASTSPTPAAPVSIYEDKTLRRGDAVMTSAGLRIFEGSVTFPYRPADFSTLDASKRVPRSIRKDLALYDHQIPDRPAVAEQAPDMVIHVPGFAQR